MTTPPAIDARDHAAAFRTLLTTALGADRVYNFGELDPEGQLPDIYALVSVQRRFAPADRQGRASRSGWRVAIRTVGTTPNECRWASMKVAEALDGKAVTIDGFQSTPLLLESGDDAEPDGGRFSALSQRTYAL